MSDLKNMSMEEKQQTIQLHMELLKKLLIDSGMIIAFDKTDDNIMFLDREFYLNGGKVKGFKIPFMELTY